MTIAFQSAVFALIAISFLLVIGVPVALASPDGWSSSKNVVFSGVSLWIGSVLFVGILNSFISQICSRFFRLKLPPPPGGGLYSSSEGPFPSGPRRRGFP
uniref:Photosystem II reaction center protein Z n=1 Tax=Picea neoveitchii TaxID=369397 RepID=A0A4Y5WYR4_9CONI|nr:photosystem II protein Z [Picea neoveitchii]YP_010384609.1 photosystem II protein Z [Picea brachytyla]YP_010413754.1 photosystem II protein Z [Picea purpurea]QDE13131.1 photosystem II protein Z [Picea neoveitchii]UGW52788.1 photosystem II protein Z [Picea brachytyla]URQ19270.1 photosystem II protein Z [Picea purpurea]